LRAGLHRESRRFEVPPKAIDQINLAGDERSHFIEVRAAGAFTGLGARKCVDARQQTEDLVGGK
jgi:hypothetical protein